MTTLMPDPCSSPNLQGLSRDVVLAVFKCAVTDHSHHACTCLYDSGYLDIARDQTFDTYEDQERAEQEYRKDWILPIGPESDRWLGDKTVRKVANNTYAERQGKDIGIRLHSTTIITFHSDDTISLDSGGWRTVTTKDRINGILPAPLAVYSDKGVWTLYRRGNEGRTVSEFYDGMRFNRHGDMITDVMVNSEAELRKVKRDIKKYVALYTDQEVTQLVQDAVDNGTAGDCLMCQARGGFGGIDHLLMHIEEGYVMATLMRNALLHVGYRDEQMPVVIRYGDIVRRAIRRYLTQVLTTSHGARPVASNGNGHF